MKRLPMRKIREALRLRADGLSVRQVALSLLLGRATVSDYLRRADVAGLSWPLPGGLGDGDLERMLFARSSGDVHGSHPQPDWAYLHRELRRKGVTLSLLWEGKLSPVMRQRHPAGERLFVDYAGPTVDVVCPQAGEVRTAQLFVATLGASSYTYVEASWTQSLPDWISSHVRAFAFFGGVPAQLVPDNLKAGVTKACFHDPVINRTYADMACHYDTAIVPARPGKPKERANGLLHNAYRLDLDGQSMRKTRAKTVDAALVNRLENHTPQCSASKVAGYPGSGGRIPRNAQRCRRRKSVSCRQNGALKLCFSARPPRAKVTT